MSNNKVKGLLKGLRYISQIFENEKEQEIQIGYPTDVKHVAHIGWDGPSVNSPSWMDEFKTPQEFSSAPLNANGEIKDNNSSVKWVSEDSSRKDTQSMNSPARDLPELPKSARRHSSVSSVTDSPTREKVHKPKSRRSSKGSKSKEDGYVPTRLSMDSSQGSQSPTRSIPDIPKKTRRKKSKESSVGSSRLRLKGQTTETYQSPYSDPGPDTSLPRPSDSELSQKSFEDEDEKGFRRIY